MRQQVIAGVRDPGRVREQYEEFWSRLLEEVRQHVREEPASLSRALHLCEAAAVELYPAKTRRLRGRRAAGVVAGRAVSPQLDGVMLVSVARAILVNSVLAACSEKTRRIVELGSGWGSNLFRLWLGGGPRDAEYVALEHTRGGREATELLAGLEPDLHLSVAPFDFHAPDLSALRSAGGTVVFTSHSIEQLTHLNPGVFEEILAIPELDRVVHLEPVGWQTWARRPWLPLWTWLVRMVPPRLSLELDFFRRARTAAYNADLLGHLWRLESRGRIRIEKLERNLVGANPLNPGSLVVWRPVL